MKIVTLWNTNTNAHLNPWRSLFDFGEHFNRVLSDRQQEYSGDAHALQPASEFDETQSHYLLSFDLPGVSKKDIRVEVKDGHLFVSAERKHAQSANRSLEHPYGKFERVLALPKDLDADRIEAQHQDGVLRIALPKGESAKPRQIEISSAA